MAKTIPQSVESQAVALLKNAIPAVKMVTAKNGRMVPAPTRGFTSYSSDDRALRTASHRLGHRQKSQIGEVFWTHPWFPGIAFGRRIDAIERASRATD